MIEFELEVHNLTKKLIIGPPMGQKVASQHSQSHARKLVMSENLSQPYWLLLVILVHVGWQRVYLGNLEKSYENLQKDQRG